MKPFKILMSKRHESLRSLSTDHYDVTIELFFHIMETRSFKMSLFKLWLLQVVESLLLLSSSPLL